MMNFVVPFSRTGSDGATQFVVLRLVFCCRFQLAEEEGQEDVIQYLTFQLGEESFALPLDSVESVERLREVTIVPGTHNAILGVINLKSAIVPVIAIHSLLNLEAQSQVVPTTSQATSYLRWCH